MNSTFFMRKFVEYTQYSPYFRIKNALFLISLSSTSIFRDALKWRITQTDAFRTRRCCEAVAVLCRAATKLPFLGNSLVFLYYRTPCTYLLTSLIDNPCMSRSAGVLVCTLRVLCMDAAISRIQEHSSVIFGQYGSSDNETKNSILSRKLTQAIGITGNLKLLITSRWLQVFF